MDEKTKVKVVEAAKELHNRFLEAGADVSFSDVEAQITKYVDFHVPVDEAVRTTQRFFTKKLGISAKGNNKTLTLGDIPVEDDVFLNTAGKVVHLFENKNDKIKQTGLIADETGSMKFTVFTKNAPEGLGLLEIGKSYTFEGVVTDVYEAKQTVSLKVLSNAIIKECTDIETEPTLTGVIVDVSDDSGLIKRCPLCKAKLQSGMCTEHGRQDGFYDVRTKVVLDNGKVAQMTVLNAALTEAVTGMTVEIAKKIAMDAVDPTAPNAEIRQRLLGKYFSIKGQLRKNRDPTRTDKTLFATVVSPLPKMTVNYPALRARIDALFIEPKTEEVTEGGE